MHEAQKRHLHIHLFQKPMHNGKAGSDFIAWHSTIRGPNFANSSRDKSFTMDQLGALSRKFLVIVPIERSHDARQRTGVRLQVLATALDRLMTSVVDGCAKHVPARFFQRVQPPSSPLYEQTDILTLFLLDHLSFHLPSTHA